MRIFLRAGAISVAVLGLAAAANAASMADMVGTWKWTDYTVECKAGGANGMSCIVIDGPKNKGMEMVQSVLTPQGDAFVGDIKHPATGDIYKTKIVLKDPDNWSLDGCTAANVCASGVFTRVK
jgi:uncharacterized protein (DUF2147 family)